MYTFIYDAPIHPRHHKRATCCHVVQQPQEFEVKRKPAMSEWA